MMITPCVGVCQIDPVNQICIGCKRTKEQVDNWKYYDHEEQMEIMKRLGYGIRMGREERLRRYDRG
jgi:predicted Fe-S protein YdhL (DUF1289 family)